jgi:RNA polymerase sigma-70 factor, ECF subfamily
LPETSIAVLPDWPDPELAAAARRRDEAAIRAIVRRHNQTLFRLARSILGDDHEAEDALQEAYVRGFERIASFRGESSLRTWLGRIVVNEALGRRRRRPGEALPVETLDTRGSADIIELPGLASHAADPERALATGEIRHVLDAAIDELPPDFRAVLVARLVEEMTVEETAQILDLKPETVKTRLHRARVLLRAGLEHRLGPALTRSFPFAGARCERMADRVAKRLAERAAEMAR